MTPRPPKTFNYAALIEELRSLYVEGANLPEESRSHASQPFRDWRNSLDVLLRHAEQNGMKVQTGVAWRHFQSLVPGALNPQWHRQAFDKDMEDTLSELKAAIRLHDTFGDTTNLRNAATAETTPRNAPVPAPPPAWPGNEKLTIGWFLQHMPVSAWLWVVGALVFVFGFGATFGRSIFLQSLLEPASQPASHATAQPGKAASK